MFVFLIPLLFDYVLGGIYFIVAYRLASEHYPAWMAGAPMVVWGILYAASSFGVGKITTPRNARRFLQLSGWGTALLSMFFILFDSVQCQLLWVALMGIVSAFYCTPFQIFAGTSSTGGNRPDRAASLYTFSWSIGTAAGCLGFGSFSERYAYGINVLLGVIMAVLATTARERTAPKDAGPSADDNAGLEASLSQSPDQMLSAWLFCGTAAFCMLMLNALLPWRGVELKAGQFLSGFALAILRLIQAFVALALLKASSWMVGGKALGIAGVLGIVSMFILAFGSDLCSYFVASALFGGCAGIIYYSLVFYALAVPERSASYISINEVLLGLAGIIGPAAGGMLTQHLGSRNVFALNGIMLLVMWLLALRYLPRIKRERK